MASAPGRIASCLVQVVQHITLSAARLQGDLQQLCSSLHSTASALEGATAASDVPAGSVAALQARLPPCMPAALTGAQHLAEMAATMLARLTDGENQVQSLQECLASSQLQLAALQGTAEAEWCGLRAEAVRSLQVTSDLGV